MSQLIGPPFGNGSDGALNITTDTTDAPIDASCSGTVGSTALNGLNDSFAAGQVIMIYQTRGTNAGRWEINKIVNYVTGTITTSSPLTYTYVNSGADQSQVIVINQYSAVNINGIYTLKGWNGDVGGIHLILCNGNTVINNNINGNGKGFSGGGEANTGNPAPRIGGSGEGTVGASVQQYAYNGNGGGGGYVNDNPGGNTTAGGGGGSNGTDGTNGTTSGAGSPIAGQGANSVGSADLTTLTFGGGGGGGVTSNSTGGCNGGLGGGAIIIISKSFTINAGGSITVNGENGNPATGVAATSGGAGGAGGSVLIKSQTSNIGTNLITALGGTGGVGNSSSGGNGGNGRIRIETCSNSGITNPLASESIGGKSWCGSLVGFIG